MPQLRVVVTLSMDQGPSLPWVSLTGELDLDDAEVRRVMQRARKATARRVAPGSRIDLALRTVLAEVAREIAER